MEYLGCFGQCEVVTIMNDIHMYDVASHEGELKVAEFKMLNFSL